MGSPGRRRSRRGYLLVEAVLSAVVIAVGLVFITRAFSGHLRALASVERYAILTELAEGALRVLEQDGQAGQPIRRDQTGAFPPPYADYTWTLAATWLEDDEAVSVVTLSVGHAQRPGPEVSVTAVWPAAQVPSEWY